MKGGRQILPIGLSGLCSLVFSLLVKATCFAGGVLLFFFSQEVHGISALPLDDEAVFCSYFKLSGEPISERDLEDFTYQKGKPSFSIFKPAEIFTKSTLRKLQEKIQEQIAGYSDVTLFYRNFKGPWYGGQFLQGATAAILINSELPRSTPYIDSAVSEAGQRELIKTYYFLLKEMSAQIKGKEIQVTVYYKPVKIRRNVQRRVIAREEIYLPMRTVVFEPKRLRVSFAIPSGRLVFFREILIS